MKATNAGGKRQGTGRKTKAPPMAAQNESTALICPKMPEDENVPEKWDYAALLIATRRKLGEVSKTLEIDEKTLYRWRQEAAFQALVKQHQASIRDNIVGALSELAPEMVGVVRRALEQDDLAAAKLVLEYTAGKPAVVNQNVNITMPPVNIIMGESNPRYIEQDLAIEGEYTVKDE